MTYTASNTEAVYEPSMLETGMLLVIIASFSFHYLSLPASSMPPLGALTTLCCQTYEFAV